MRKRPIKVVEIPIYERDLDLWERMPPYGKGAWAKEVLRRVLQQEGTVVTQPAKGAVVGDARQIEEEIVDWLRNDIVPELIEIIREEVRNEVRRALEGQVSAVVTEDASNEAEESSDPIETWQPTKAWIESLRG